jgi:GNAT superfamily N-acetyltransferase
LREVLVPADEPYLRNLYASVREPELAVTPWSPEQKRAFCDSQYRLQDQHYRQHYPMAHFMVIEQRTLDLQPLAQPVGRIYIDCRAQAPLGLMDIALQPSHRKQGLGTLLLGWLCEWADTEGRAVGLYVEAENPASRLYLRHGFVDQGQEGLYRRMVRPAGC